MVCHKSFLESRSSRIGCELDVFSAACRAAREEKAVSSQPLSGGLGPINFMDRPPVAAERRRSFQVEIVSNTPITDQAEYFRMIPSHQDGSSTFRPCPSDQVVILA